MLIMISSDLASRESANLTPTTYNTVGALWADEAHFLCDDTKEMRLKCDSLDKLGPNNLGLISYRGRQVDYALYNAIDINQA